MTEDPDWFKPETRIRFEAEVRKLQESGLDRYAAEVKVTEMMNTRPLALPPPPEDDEENEYFPGGLWYGL